MLNTLKIFITIGFISLLSCDDYLEVPYPSDQLTSETVFGSKSTIDAAILGVYNSIGGLSSTLLIRNTWLMSDEIEYLTPASSDLYNLNIGLVLPQNQWVNDWSTQYVTIYRANAIIEGLKNVSSSVLKDSEKKAFEAEAKYLRAASYFRIVTSWGGCPLIISTKLEVNVPRSSVADVYALIESDLTEASANLPKTVIQGNSYRIHNNLQVEALLSRVYLYQGKWDKAEVAASKVIDAKAFDLLTQPNDVFKRGSKESIFSLREINTTTLFLNRVWFGWNNLPLNSASGVTLPSLPTVMLAKFEPNDLRIKEGNWVTTLFNKKFPTKYLHNSAATSTSINANPQDLILQRLAEIYLIRAEARARLNKLDDAKVDLNTIRKRASLPNSNATTQENLLLAIENERVFELFHEGHRWYDIIRVGKANQIFGSLPNKKDNWKSHLILWPIIARELESNTALTQNPGYN